MSKIDPATLADLKAKHGNAELVHLPEQGIVLKGPNRAQYLRFKKLQREGDVSQASEQLVRDCVVYPEPSVLDALLDRQPFLIDVLATEVAQLGGLGERVHREKL